jgi:archaellum component FlaC
MVTLRDTLQTRILGDQHLFFTFAAGGSLVIVLTKAFTDWRMAWIAAGAVALMFVYAGIVGRRGVGKLRADQAGDNCYYLGLIYTLTSLAFAIFTFDPEETANVIVNGFGVALATTIVGLILRVFFNQSRVDVHEIEEDARQELVEAASRLKTQLNQISMGFSDFALGLQQSMDELRQAATSSVKDSSEQAINTVRQLASAADEGLKNQTGEFKEQVALLTKASDASRRALERHADSLAELAERQQGTANSLETMQEIVVATAEASEKLRDQQQAMAELQGAMNSLAEGLTNNATKLNSATEGSISALSNLTHELEARLDQFEHSPTRSMDAALLAIAKAAERLENSINNVATQHEDIRQSLVTSSQELLRALEEHNKALEGELARSRSNFSRVSQGIVDVIDDLREEVRKPN